MSNELTEFFGEAISTYTSEQATEDGILIKVNHPIINYITHTVFERCIEPFIEKEKGNEKLIRKLLDSAFEAARKTGRDDHLYTDLDVRGWKLWLGQNETGKYTLMFPEDY